MARLATLTDGLPRRKDGNGNIGFTETVNRRRANNVVDLRCVSTKPAEEKNHLTDIIEDVKAERAISFVFARHGHSISLQEDLPAFLFDADPW